MEIMDAVVEAKAGSPSVEELFDVYRGSLIGGRLEEAMLSFEALLEAVEAKRHPLAFERYFIRLVLDDGLMLEPVCAATVRRLEPRALRALMRVYRDCPFTQDDALQLAGYGLGRMGQFMFIHSRHIELKTDSLVKAERLFTRPFTLTQLLILYYNQALSDLIAPFCALYLSRDDGLLPLNNPASGAADIDLLFFGAKLPSASSFTGLSEVMTQYAQAPQGRKAALAVDLLMSLEHQGRAEMELELRRQVGDDLIDQAVATIERTGLGKNVKYWQYPASL